MLKIHSEQHKGSKCLNCGYTLNASTGINGEGPKPGDITICINCRHVMSYGDGLTMCELTKEQQIMIAGDPDFLLLMKCLEKASKES